MRTLNPIIISENSKSWVFAVGGFMVKGKVTHMNQSQPQAVPEYQLKQYRHLFNQSKASGALPKESEQVRENLNWDRLGRKNATLFGSKTAPRRPI